PRMSPGDALSICREARRPPSSAGTHKPAYLLARSYIPDLDVAIESPCGGEPSVRQDCPADHGIVVFCVGDEFPAGRNLAYVLGTCAHVAIAKGGEQPEGGSIAKNGRWKASACQREALVQ